MKGSSISQPRTPALLDVTDLGGAVQFRVRVQPRASRDAIGGTWQGALKVRLTAPPVDDRANAACRRLLAGHLNIPVSAVRILTGERSRTKLIEVRGASGEQVQQLAATEG